MKYVVHIGYAKAASSWLQQTVFAGVDSRILPLDQSKIVNGACKSGGAIFYNQTPPSPADKESRLKHPYQVSAFGSFDSSKARVEVEARTNSNAMWTCLSNEAWAGHPYSGGIHGAIYLKRIKAVLPEAKILVVVRNPLSAIISAYADYMERVSGICNFSEFIAPNLLNQVPRFQIGFYKYIDLITAYDNAFGRENVIVIPFEFIQQSTEKFILPLYQSLGISMPAEIPTNKKINARNYKKLYLYEKFPLINMFGRKTHANGNGALEWFKVHQAVSQLHRLIPNSASKMHRKVIEGILLDTHGDYLSQSNKALEARININLRELGYIT